MNKLITNFSYLSVLQIVNFALPLLSIPYLVRVLGVEYFGLLAFATSLVTYFNIITDYGFNLTATREISLHKNNKEELIKIYSSVLSIKFLLLLLSFIILISIVFTFQKFTQDWHIYLITFGIVVGQALFPIWFFQGMEVMKYITLLNISTKSIFTVAIFIFINDKSDFYLVPLFSSSASIFVGLYALLIVKQKFNVDFKFQHYNTLIYYLKESYLIFISNVAISFYTVSTTFILGLLTNNTIVGYFSAAEKIIIALKSLMGIVSQTIFPYIIKVHSKDENQAILFVRKILLGMSGISLFIFALLFLFSKEIILFVLGDDYVNSIIVLQILAILPFVTALSNIFGIHVLIIFGYKKVFQKIMVSAAMLHIMTLTTLVYFFNLVGASLALVGTESLISLAMFIYILRKRILIIKKDN